MSYLKFNHVFAGLMLLSLFSAFVLNPNITNPARAQVQNLFAPAALPIRSFAGWLHDKIRGSAVIDVATGSANNARPDELIRLENARLRETVTELLGRASQSTAGKSREYLFGTIVSQLVPDEARSFLRRHLDTLMRKGLIARAGGSSPRTTWGGRSGRCARSTPPRIRRSPATTSRRPPMACSR